VQTLDLRSLMRRLDEVPALAGAPRTVEELSGGLTNINLKVTTPAGVFVARCFRGDAGLLGIDRDAESVNTAAAAEAGVGPRVVEYRPDLGMLVIEFLPGVPLENGSFADDGVLTRSAAACRRLHAGPRFSGEFDMFTRQAAYLGIVRERGFALPATYDDHADDWVAVRRALAADPRPTVPCNNDLLAANFIDDGDRVWLIDYEYSGNNDACFELGNTSTECDFAPEQTEAYTEAYFGTPTPADLARVRLQSLCSEYGWALWGFIQAATSPMDFDFHGWGMERFDKAEATFRGPGFGQLLAEVADGG
jgi:thiamine kinase-like enzyme